LNVNCQSIVNKAPLFHNLIDSTKPDIIIATETWLNSGMHDAEFFNLDHYTVHRRDRITDTVGGGVIVAVNKEFISTREEDLEKDSTEIVWVKVSIARCKKLYIGGCYRAKADDSLTIEALDTALHRLSGGTGPILLGGDFNFPGWDWTNHTLKPNCPHPDLHNQFADIINDNGLSQIVREPTRKDNILDLIITNRPNQTTRIQSLPGIGDHNAVFAEMNIKPARRKQTPREIPLYHKADWLGLRKFMEETADLIRGDARTSTAEHLWSTLRDRLQEGIKKFIPHKTTKTQESCRWINRDLKRKINRRNKAFKTSRRRGRHQDERRFQKLKIFLWGK